MHEADLNSSRMRSAGRDALSLALIDSRNLSLRWIALYEETLAASRFSVPQAPGLEPPLWLLGHLGWFQEYWIARNVQRQRGPACDAVLPRLASVLPEADAWYDPTQASWASRWQMALPELQPTKQYLGETIDITLDLLAGINDSDTSDAALHFFRLALFHEDQHAETWAQMAQTLGLSLASAKGLLPDIVTAPARPPLVFPASVVMQGAQRGGFVFDNEKWAHEVRVPEFELDAQPVSWAQYAEFVEDGGYDDSNWWSAEGWTWLQREGRRVPRHVDQMRQGVLQQRFGRLMRVPLLQPAMHVSWYEADAWCRWAGRRLPTEVEWEGAALAGATRGFRWGDVWEWTAATFRPYPGFSADPPADRSEHAFGTHKVLRGASFATPGRLRHAKYRRYELPQRDDLFSGFRSCAA